MATPGQIRRRGRLALFTAVFAGAFVAVAIALGAVSTDRYTYNIGDTVQITGDGMNANENVTVDVNYPDNSLAQEHVVQADGSGNFSDSYTIQQTDPTGIYTVTATGQDSTNVFTTTFDPAVQANCLQFDNGGNFDPVTPSVTVNGTNIDISWRDQCSDEDNYYVQRSTSASGPWTTIATLAGISGQEQAPNESGSYTDQTADCGTTYYYRIEAKRTSGPNTWTSDSNASAGISFACPVTPSISTTVKDASDGTGTGTPPHFPLGSTIHDSATLSVASGDPPEGTVDFKLYKGSTCADRGTTAGTQVGSTDSESLGSSDNGQKDSSGFATLQAANYYFLVTYTSNNAAKWNSVSTPTCEDFTIDKGTPTVTTDILNGSTVITVATVGTAIHDKATVGGVTGITPTGKVDFKLYRSSNCTGTQIGSGSQSNVSLDGSGVAEMTTTYTIVAADIPALSYLASYQGDSNYDSKDASCESLTVVPASAVTDSSLCTFDFDSSLAGSQFRLIYTPDVGAPTYKLNASNPGQFYYNVFYSGPATTLNIGIPAPFVTQGAVPIHVYSGVTVSGTSSSFCLTPGTQTGQVSLPQGTGGTLDVPVGAGFSYITIHLDYGYKGLDGCTKDSTTLKATCGSVIISSPKTYSFSDGSSGTATVQSENVFKKDPGIGGLVTQASTGNPVVGATVKIYDGSNKLLGTVTTDSDGWYMWAYKYTGKAATFVVKLPAYNQSQTVTLKSNSFLVVNFTV